MEDFDYEDMYLDVPTIPMNRVPSDASIAEVQEEYDADVQDILDVIV